MRIIEGHEGLLSIIRESDYERCSSMEIIKVFPEDIMQLTAPGAQAEYYFLEGSFDGILPMVRSLPPAEKMIVYTLQDPAGFDEDELDRMCTCFDTLTRMKTAYGLKMTDKYKAQFHIFIRRK